MSAPAPRRTVPRLVAVEPVGHADAEAAQILGAYVGPAPGSPISAREERALDRLRGVYVDEPDPAEQHDDQGFAGGREADAPEPPSVLNGCYTLRNDGSGEHRTFRVRTVQKGALTGRRVLELLTGPDNTSDYEGFAFVVEDDAGRTGTIVWRRFRAAGLISGAGAAWIDGYSWSERWSAHQKMAAMLFDVLLRGAQSHFRAAGYSLHVEARCRRCNRLLTTPQSIAAGIGPECAQREDN